MHKNKVIIGENEISKTTDKVGGEYVRIENEDYFKISNSHEMRPFFMSIVSDSNHWMFISSNGALTAGRKNSESSLFPYYTDDKITESLEISGSKTILRICNDNQFHLWEPFSDLYKGIYKIQRNLYKNVFGNKIIFEEINTDLALTFSYQWNSSNIYGFVRKASLINNSDKKIEVEVLDGLQNILPYGVTTEMQNTRSNLVDAYKRSELHPESGIGVYALSSIIVDKAEPSEALKASIAWSAGLEGADYLLSSQQLPAFRKGKTPQREVDIKAEKGAYFIYKKFFIEADGAENWMIVANVNQSVSDIVRISKKLKADKEFEAEILKDIETGTENLVQLAAATDALQITEDKLRCARHYSNVLYNIMRGGIFDDQYTLEKSDFETYLKKANKSVYTAQKKTIDKLPESITLTELKDFGEKSQDVDLQRLSREYLPLKFSRRHGDPSRPWNKFSINTRSEIDGSKILDYEGNWRDIFQNWEALAHSYPEFIDGMIFKFLNASTFEGYNPYRVTKDGFDWEVIEPDDPWSYIGYWGDHQIIYLLKFLEFIEDYYPSRLEDYFEQEIFVYANVPYKIKSYEDILSNPKDTIEFDLKLDGKIRSRRVEIGGDGALLTDSSSEIYRVNLIEKLLATLMAKISNFIPEAGIWLNTQRPEWNDANNALVGNGVSMVTLYYLRRFLSFLTNLISKSQLQEVKISSELAAFFKSVKHTLEKHQNQLTTIISDEERKAILDGLGMPGSRFREEIYVNAFSGSKETISKVELCDFLDLALRYMEHSIDANKREDGMYHAYNLVSLEDSSLEISYLSEMLEGQVAVLSSGYLSDKETNELLDSLAKSALFRKDQYSYLLYPEKDLPGFLVKNTIPEQAVKQSVFLSRLVEDGNRDILEKDVSGSYHFNGSFNNAEDLKNAMSQLSVAGYADLINRERDLVLEVFEDVFDHKAFTGRSGTFFGYEGLGSIYWHMVSKLLLAVEECCLKALEEQPESPLTTDLIEHYYKINEGIGVHKSPDLYGAFPTDPYSHTPATKGAQQPGMTGQVKEDVLSRMGELGLMVKEGRIRFDSGMLDQKEFLQDKATFSYISVAGIETELNLEKGSLCFTYVQVPVIYKLGNERQLRAKLHKKPDFISSNLELDSETSQSIFSRSGEVDHLVVTFNKDEL